MKHGEKICYQVTIKSSKEFENYVKREENYIDSTPKITVGKFDNNIL